MNKKIDILTARNAFALSLFIAAAILVFLAPKTAVNVDEQLHYPHAKNVVNWYVTGGKDTSCLDTPVSNLKYYGQSVDNLTALINRTFLFEDEFLTRHYTGAFFFWILLLFAGLVGFQISRSYWVSAITVVLILLMPRLFGQAFGNLKDIPFATGYTIGIFLIIQFLKEMPGPRWSTSILLGFAIAFTCSVRIGGLILIPYLALFVAIQLFVKPFVPKQNVSTKPCLVRLLGQGIVIVLIGYFVGLLFWPFALQDVFRNPLESLRVMEHYKVSIRQVFEGNLTWSTQLPWYYLPKWIFISTPEFIFFGLILYLIFRMKNLSQLTIKQLNIELFLVFALLFPVFYVMIIRSNLYSGIRQMLFVLPLLAVFASMGIFLLINSQLRRTSKMSLVVFIFALLILPLKHQTQTFPVDYVYFNSVSGGNKNAWGKYEYDYYFHGIKESSRYLIDLVGEREVTVATNCNLSNYFENTKNIKYQYAPYLERSSEDWDYGVFGLNYIHPEMMESGKWFSVETIKTFFHKDNPVVVLLQRKNTDIAAFKQIKLGNDENAERLFLEAVKIDPNNVWLYVQLAKISLEKNNIESFKRYLHNGRELYPSYEPFFLLEAQHFFNEGNYIKSKEVLKQLISVNARYEPAVRLIDAVNDKLNI